MVVVLLILMVLELFIGDTHHTTGLLPSYYFRGKQITRNDAPLGSQEAEIIEDDSFGGVSRIYRLPERFEL